MDLKFYCPEPWAAEKEGKAEAGPDFSSKKNAEVFALCQEKRKNGTLFYNGFLASKSINDSIQVLNHVHINGLVSRRVNFVYHGYTRLVSADSE